MKRMNETHEMFFEENYLKEELYELLRNDPLLFDFIQDAMLDGIWYWDFENQENEWMSERFWKTFGYDPSEKQHLSSEWQEMIHPDDLLLVQKNLAKHIEDPSYPYDQVVRYTHKNGSIVWVRCRGIALHDHSGNVTRILGAHNDVTNIMQKQQELIQEKLKHNQTQRELAKVSSDFLELERNYKYLEHQNSLLGYKDDITHLYNFEGYFETVKKIPRIASRLGVNINLFSVSINNADYIQKNFSTAELQGKLLTVQCFMSEILPEMELLHVSSGFIFGMSMGYSSEEFLDKKEEVKAALTQYAWSIVHPDIFIKISTQESPQKFSKDLLNEWIVSVS